MATDDDERSPFTRPGFIAAAVVIALVVVLGIVLVIVNATDEDDPGPTPTSPASTSAAPTPNTTAVAGGESVCGLRGEVLTGTVTTAPDAEWQYVGTVAYPTSETFGPAESDPAGFGYCFQHSPEGALFAAAQAVAQGSVPDNRAWIEYFAAEGPYRDQLLAEGTGGTSSEGTRLRIAGFRVLSYDGDTARIDLAGEGSTAEGSITFSAVYDLVWQGGDWKVSTDTATPFDFASIPNFVGYVAWGA